MRFDYAWEAFLKYIGQGRSTLQEDYVPVAVILLKGVEELEGGGVSLDMQGQVTVVWPADFPAERKAYIMANLAKQYMDNVTELVQIHKQGGTS